MSPHPTMLVSCPTGAGEPSRPRSRRVLAAGLCLGVLACHLAADSRCAAAPPVEVESVRMGFGAGNAFKVGCWTPVRVQLRAGSEGFSGVMALVVPDDDGVPTAYRQPVEIAANQGASLTVYARPGGRDTEFTLRFLDARGRRVQEVTQEKLMPSQPTAIMPDELLILMLGSPLGVEQIPTLPGFTQGGKGPNQTSSSEVIVERLDVGAGQLPGRWYGLDAAHAIVIDTEDRAVMRELGTLRGQVLVDWVNRGGHLIVAVGGNWQAVRESALAPLLPALPAGEERVPSLEALDSFANSTKPITPPGTPPQLVTKLEGAEQKASKILSITGSLPLVVRGAFGFGRVTLIGLSANQKLFSDWADRGLFWARALDLRAERSEQAGGAAGATLGGTGRFYRSGISDLSSQLRVGLEQFPGVKLIPFGWVAFFIFLYILLIGPGDYFFLKKVLKRMELTWITFPTIVLTVSLLAYFAAYRFKGNDLLVNKVDVVDVDEAAGLVRGRSIASLFSPQNRDYSLGFLPVAPGGPREVDPLASPGTAGEAARPTPGTELLTTWFSVPESQFGAMGGANRRFSFSGGGYSYQPNGTMERLENLRVPIWSTRSVTARWFGSTSGPLVESALRPVGRDRLAGSVVNRLDYTLEDAVLAFGKQVYFLGDLAPGARVQVELTSGFRNLSGLLKDRAPNYLPDQYGNRNGRVNRGDLLMALMFHESESARSTEHALSNVVLNDLDLTGQLALDRPMLVGRVKRPGARFVIDNAGTTPRVDQTTMLRIILPLRPAGDGQRASASASASGTPAPAGAPRPA